MAILEEEIQPWDDPSEASVEYRKQLTKSLLYKVGCGNFLLNNITLWIQQFVICKKQ